MASIKEVELVALAKRFQNKFLRIKFDISQSITRITNAIYCERKWEYKSMNIESIWNDTFEKGERLIIGKVGDYMNLDLGKTASGDQIVSKNYSHT